MTSLGYAALFGWAPITLILFAVLPPRRAVLVSLLGGWLFLPMAAVPVPGLPDITKISVVAVSCLLGALLFDGQRLFSFRPRWVDLPMLAWCLCPIPSAIAAGLGAYAGLAAGLDLFMQWGVPYLIGRIYFIDRNAHVELLVAVSTAGLIYMLFCWFEIRMSPRLHLNLYGFEQHSWVQTRRFGGWRPMVFLSHGLAVAMFMATAALASFALWRAQYRRSLIVLSAGWATLLLVITCILCKTLGALLLLAGGAIGVASARRLGRNRKLLYLLAVAPLLILVRFTGTLETETILNLTSGILSEERLQSLQVRLASEDTLVLRAKQRLTTGWGPHGDFRDDDSGKSVVKSVDGFYVIAFGKYGLLGLTVLMLMLLTPGWRAARHLRPRGPGLGIGVIAGAHCVLLALYMIDLAFNAMISPVYLLSAGALTTGVEQQRRRSRK